MPNLNSFWYFAFGASALASAATLGKLAYSAPDSWLVPIVLMIVTIILFVAAVIRTGFDARSDRYGDRPEDLGGEPRFEEMENNPRSFTKSRP